MSQKIVENIEGSAGFPGRGSFLSKVRDWILHHPLMSFFGITFAISWGLGFTYGAVFLRDQVLWMPLASLATCAPGLVGIGITSIKAKEQRSGSTWGVWLAFLAAWVLAIAVFVAQNMLVNQAPFSLVMVALLSVIAIPVAFILSKPFSRNAGVRHYLSSVIKIRKVWGWLLFSILLMAGTIAVSVLVSAAIGRHSLHSFRLPHQGWRLLILVGITFLYQLFFYNLTGEEIGWRGFALPRLQARISPLVASLVLTPLWALWHVFYFHALGDSVFELGYWLDTFVRLFPATVIINWFYNRSKGSILVAGVAHAAANTFFAYVPGLDWPVHTAVSYVVVMALIIIDRMWRKLPKDHPAVIAPIV